MAAMLANDEHDFPVPSVFDFDVSLPVEVDDSIAAIDLLLARNHEESVRRSGFFRAQVYIFI